MKEKFCVACHHVGKPKTVNRGSFAMELLLWLCFIVPGLIYSLWRITSGVVTVCRECGNEDLIPVGSVRARQLRGEA